MQYGQNSQSEEVLRGVIDRITYNNPENGYSVLQIQTNESIKPITVVGNVIGVRVGMHILARGIFKEHAKFGRQLSASSITETEPSNIDGIARYLGSGLIKGIGPATAQRIVEKFGTEALDVIYKNPNRLAAIPGVGTHKAKLISQAFAQQRDVREVMQFLIENGITTNLASKIYHKYENRAVEILKKNPYILARDLKGVGFITADTIAKNLGISHDSPERLKAGLFFTLEKSSEDGHCYLTEDELVERGRRLLDVSEEVNLHQEILKLLEEDMIVSDGDKYMLHYLKKGEDFIADFINNKAEPQKDLSISEREVESAINQAEKELGLTLSEQQRDAVYLAAKNRILIVTGGPGCGKTTVIKALSYLFKSTGKILQLAAPTGRAAQRMAQVCEHPASTIHRLLRFDPRKGKFQYGIDDPLPAQAIIIDEASMIDVPLAFALFQSISNNATLILVGDKDQLPSVGPGKVFGDLINSKSVPTIFLSQIFRRSEESTINHIAHLINAGSLPEIPEPDGKTKVDAYFLPRKDAEDAALMIEKLVSDQIPRKFGIDTNDILVLTPSNRGPLGTQSLNLRLQAKLNPPGSVDSEQEIKLATYDLRVRDRICQRVNNYDIDEAGVFNGDTGVVDNINKTDSIVTIDLWDGRLIKYSFGQLNELSLAYASTVHRAQGSEIPCVVLALHESHFALLERQLIYTAVTRAKKLLIIVGSKKALFIASKRTSAGSRNTRLIELLLENSAIRDQLTAIRDS